LDFRFRTCATLFAGLWALAAGAHTTYRLTDVAPANAYEVSPRVNNHGAVGGSMFDGSDFRAFIYDDAGLHLQPLQGHWNIVHALSDKGELGGYCQGLSDYPYRDLGCRWAADGAPRRPLRLGLHSDFTDINSQGLATAYYWPRTHNGPSHTRAIVVTRHGEVTELGKLGGEDTDAVATAINDSGWAVGYASKVMYGPNYAFIHDGSGMRELDAAGRPGRAFDVNDLGDAVGDDDGGGRPLLFRGGAATDLGTVTEAAKAHATSINLHGDIVGCEKQWDRRREMAVIWPGGKAPRRLTGMLDPATGAGWELTCATSINKSGQITGYGRRGDGDYRIFLLTPME
jgi:uncharacterized membrane protein